MEYAPFQTMPYHEMISVASVLTSDASTLHLRFAFESELAASELVILDRFLYRVLHGFVSSARHLLFQNVYARGHGHGHGHGHVDKLTALSAKYDAWLSKFPGSLQASARSEGCKPLNPYRPRKALVFPLIIRCFALDSHSNRHCPPAQLDVLMTLALRVQHVIEYLCAEVIEALIFAKMKSPPHLRRVTAVDVDNAIKRDDELRQLCATF